MKPSKKTILNHVDAGTRPDALERELARWGYNPEDTTEAIEELVADGTLTRGMTSSGVWIVVTESSPAMVAAIRNFNPGRVEEVATNEKRCHAAGGVLTDCQKQYLMDTEASDEGLDGDLPDNSDAAVMRRVLRGLREYRRYKEQAKVE